MGHVVTARGDGFFSVDTAGGPNGSWSTVPAENYYEHADAVRLAAQLDREDAEPASRSTEVGHEWGQEVTLRMILALLNGGNILVPDADVSVGVPASPAGVQRRAVFVLPVQTSSSHTITLLSANAQEGSFILLVLPGVAWVGAAYAVMNGGEGGGLLFDVNMAGNFGGRQFFSALLFQFSGVDWQLVSVDSFGGERLSMAGLLPDGY